jgi:hypothetical protein
MTAPGPQAGKDLSGDRDFRAQFAPAARRERDVRRHTMIVGAIGALLVLPMFFLEVSESYVKFVILPACLTGMGLAFWSIFRGRRLKCPACTQRIEMMVRFCPVCGTDGLEKAGRIPALDPTVRCLHCDKDYIARSGVNRRIPVHFCTHCGVWLDEEGI